MNRLIFIFLSFFFIMGSTTISAQSPGGVAGMITWEKEMYPSYRMLNYAPHAFNYHSYDLIANDGHLLELKLDKLDRYTLFMVYNYNGNYEFANIYSGQAVTSITDTSVNSSIVLPFVSYDYYPKFLTYISTGKTGNKRSNEPAHLSIGNLDFDRDMQTGGLAEVLLYDRVLSSDQVNQVESYLALKYGISLPEKTDYYNANGDILWNATAHFSYGKNLTAIGFDKAGALNIKQSFNAKSDSRLEIGLGAIYDKNNENPNIIQDQNFMFWSDNGDDLKFESIGNHSRAQRLERQWKVNIEGSNLLKRLFQLRIQTDEWQGINEDYDFFIAISEDVGGSIDLKNSILYKMNKSKNQLVVNNLVLTANRIEAVIFTIIQIPKIEDDPDYDFEWSFANPILIDELFTMQIQTKDILSGFYTIHDSQGQLIHQKELIVDQELDIREKLPIPGSYVVSLHLNDQVQSKVLIVQ